MLATSFKVAISPDFGADFPLRLPPPNPATQIAHGRVITGVHYPIDVISGQELGNAYADIVVAQPTFADAAERIHGTQP
ncbi:MAG: hypothetical protein AAGG65_01585 [Pseudomonadota bacterium]